MATSTLTRRLAKIAKQSGAPKGTKPAMFDAFLKAAAPQIRSAFRARHDDEAVFDVLGNKMLVPIESPCVNPREARSDFKLLARRRAVDLEPQLLPLLRREESV